jgi:hypothetical protein
MNEEHIAEVEGDYILDLGPVGKPFNKGRGGYL